MGTRQTAALDRRCQAAASNGAAEGIGHAQEVRADRRETGEAEGDGGTGTAQR